jgi:hypothetical protein
MNNYANKTYRCSVCFSYCETLKDETCLECLMCAGKIKYTSLAVANAASEWFFEKDELVWLGSYKCTFCDQFHLGHSELKLAS